MTYVWKMPNRMISIHTTLAGGDPGYEEIGSSDLISIHTTLAGGDKTYYSGGLFPMIFQSTPPSRVATSTP